MRYEMILNGTRYDIVDQGNRRRSDYTMCRNATHEDAKVIVDALNHHDAVTAIEPTPV